MALLVNRMILVGLALMPWTAMASVLTAIDVHPVNSDEMQLALKFNGGVAELQGYHLDDPPRLTLDLADTQNGLGQRHIEVGQGGVGQISVLEGGGRTRLVIGLTKPLDYTSQAMDDQLHISLQTPWNTGLSNTEYLESATDVQPEKHDSQRRFTGERLSLNVQDMDIRAVLATLAEFTGLNLIASDSVAGRITLNLNDVPWDQALALILHSQGLSSRESDNVILVAPAGELAELERQKAEAQSHHETLSPLVSELIEVKYARAENLAQLLRGNDGFGLLTERGRISVDPRTNALWVQDTAEQVESIMRTLARLDVPVRQVQIEARIVIARDTASRELGVNWGASSTRGFQAAESGNFARRNINPGGLNRARGGLAVDLGSPSGPGTGFSFGYLSGDVLLDLELRALESEGKSQTISQPRVITANQRTAIIRQGEERAFQSVDVQGNPDTQFKEAELSLEVTPQITPDNRIIMDLVIKNDSFRESGFGGEPPIDTNQIETQVLVDNGQTVVLGGILTTEQLSQMAKTPLLGDIPLLGRLFRYTEESNEKVELLVFITPRLLDDGLAVR
ncbi:type IV pilus secretin PilQ [Vreelandella populi]|uniref:type IV pilus secretin PilQ n=1 Tax=Vreelandella populi TaxID=2498858 RepID=UPI000F8D829F|nr:type IV pilus secretin family protein [Halomonas populi]RUR52987.1 type IV pilus secretin family protein [Halomonas populi]